MKGLVWWTCAWLLFGLPVTAAADASKSEERAAARPPREKAPATDVGDGDGALAAIVHVGVPGKAPPGITFAGTLGYGLTEKTLGTTGASHRIMGRLGIGLRATEWLAFALRFDGRYDAHGGGDDGFVGDPWITVRAGSSFGALRLGGEVGVWLPGNDAPSIAFDATTVDAKLLLAYDVGALTLALNGGFRLDQSDKSVSFGAALTPGDALSLGVSSWNSVPFGIGASYRPSAAVEILGELSAQMLVGDGAPSFLESPVRADVGIRYGMSRRFALEARGEVALSSRPQGVAGAVPVEPRFSVMLGVRYALPFGGDAVLGGVRATEESALSTRGVVRGIVLDADGRPVRDAKVTVDVGGATQSTVSDTRGRFRFASVPEGEGSVTVSADGYEDEAVSMSVVGGKTEEREVTLEQTTPRGQLRGLIRAFDGSPLVATVVVTPGDLTVTADAEGRFELDVPPGSYQVSVSVDGYEGQRRKVRIDENGVTVFNAELHREKRKK
jgi:hypothetical protein